MESHVGVLDQVLEVYKYVSKCSVNQTMLFNSETKIHTFKTGPLDTKFYV